jgi:hypothetical protein
VANDIKFSGQWFQVRDRNLTPKFSVGYTVHISEKKEVIKFVVANDKETIERIFNLDSVKVNSILTKTIIRREHFPNHLSDELIKEFFEENLVEESLRLIKNIEDRKWIFGEDKKLLDRLEIEYELTLDGKKGEA